VLTSDYQLLNGERNAAGVYAIATCHVVRMTWWSQHVLFAWHDDRSMYCWQGM